MGFRATVLLAMSILSLMNRPFPPQVQFPLSKWDGVQPSLLHLRLVVQLWLLNGMIIMMITLISMKRLIFLLWWWFYTVNIVDADNSRLSIQLSCISIFWNLFWESFISCTCFACFRPRTCTTSTRRWQQLRQQQQQHLLQVFNTC